MWRVWLVRVRAVVHVHSARLELQTVRVTSIGVDGEYTEFPIGWSSFQKYTR